MSIQSLGGSAFSAMDAFSTGMNAVAHNIANVNTAGFEPLSVRYATGARGEGVQLGSVRTTESSPLGGDESAFTEFGTGTLLPPEAENPGGTDVAREFTTMISTERAFEANAAAVGTWDEMLGTLLDARA